MARPNRFTIYGGIIVLIIIGLVITKLVYQATNQPERDTLQDARDARYQQSLQKDSEHWQKVKEDAAKAQ